MDNILGNVIVLVLILFVTQINTLVTQMDTSVTSNTSSTEARQDIKKNTEVDNTITGSSKETETVHATSLEETYTLETQFVNLSTTPYSAENHFRR